VDIATEFANLIVAQRGFEATPKRDYFDQITQTNRSQAVGALRKRLSVAGSGGSQPPERILRA